MYATAAISVPVIVAKGMVLSGLKTELAGTVAASTPTKDHNVRVAASVNALIDELEDVLKLLVIYDGLK